MNDVKKSRAAALIAVLALSHALLTGCGKAPATAAPPAEPRDPLTVSVNPQITTSLTLGTVGMADVRETMRVTGRIEVDETRMARVGSSVTGRVTDLEATVGQMVRRGQVLATINSTELSNAQLSFLKAYSQRLLAERAASRSQQLLDADVIGTAEHQRRLSELTQANAELSAASGQLKVLGMSERAIATLRESRSVNSVAQIVSSIAGTVIERKVTEGQVVQPADSIYLVADLSRVWIVADIPEQSASLVRVGEQLEAEIAALAGRRLSGKLSFVSPTVHPESRTIRARMDVPNPAGDYKPAMLATVLIKGAAQRRTVVPVDAVVRDENREYVFVMIGDGRYQARLVNLGPEYEGLRIVHGGVREGERIVVEGAFHLNNERKRRELQGA